MMPVLQLYGQAIELALKAFLLKRGVSLWAAAGFMDTLLRCEMKSEVGYGNKTAVQPGVQA